MRKENVVGVKMKRRRCRRCRTYKPVEQFDEDTEERGNLSLWCNPCKEIYRKEFNAEQHAWKSVLALTPKEHKCKTIKALLEQIRISSRKMGYSETEIDLAETKLKPKFTKLSFRDGKCHLWKY